MFSKIMDHVWVMSGNHSFLGFKVPVRIDNPFYGAEFVLKNLVEFEKQCPNIRVTNWKPETHMVKVPAPSSFEMHNKAFPHCFGIWIDHEPIKKSETEELSDLDTALGQD